MLPLTDTAFAALAKEIGHFDLDSTVVQVGGLLTVPSLQPFTLRLELLTHLAVLHCKGTRVASLNDVTSWLNDYLGQSPVALLEDPPEDVFLSNSNGFWQSSSLSGTVGIG